eukprot:scaffold620_cov103-Cylindrotheca_fusiformis.AAC.10
MGRSNIDLDDDDDNKVSSIMTKVREQPKLTLSEKARRVLDEAPQTLQRLEQAYIFQKSGAKRREFPTFDSSEIESGSALGHGGFSTVREVASINLIDDNTAHSSVEDPQLHDDPGKDHEHHYDVETARTFMAQNSTRLGSARYAIKRLKPDLDEFHRARGALDLAVEMKFLSSFWHPNIGR